MIEAEWVAVIVAGVAMLGKAYSFVKQRWWGEEKRLTKEAAMAAVDAVPVSIAGWDETRAARALMVARREAFPDPQAEVYSRANSLLLASSFGMLAASVGEGIAEVHYAAVVPAFQAIKAIFVMIMALAGFFWLLSVTISQFQPAGQLRLAMDALVQEHVGRAVKATGAKQPLPVVAGDFLSRWRRFKMNLRAAFGSLKIWSHRDSK